MCTGKQYSTAGLGVSICTFVPVKPVHMYRQAILHRRSRADDLERQKDLLFYGSMLVICKLLHSRHNLRRTSATAVYVTPEPKDAESADDSAEVNDSTRSASDIAAAASSAQQRKHLVYEAVSY